MVYTGTVLFLLLLKYQFNKTFLLLFQGFSLSVSFCLILSILDEWCRDAGAALLLAVPIQTMFSNQLLLLLFDNTNVHHIHHN